MKLTQNVKKYLNYKKCLMSGLKHLVTTREGSRLMPYILFVLLNLQATFRFGDFPTECFLGGSTGGGLQQYSDELLRKQSVGKSPNLNITPG